MSNSEISLWDLFGILRRHLLLFLVGAAAVFILVAAVTFVLPRKYRSEAQLQLKLGRENLGLDPATALADQASVSMAQSPDQEINTIANVLRSRNIAERVVEELTPDIVLSEDEPGFVDNLMSDQPSLAEGMSHYHTLSRNDQAIWTIQDKIKIRPVKESNTIKVHYDCKNPELAKTIVDCYVNQYMKEHRRIHNVRGSEKFLRDVVAKNKADMEKDQAELEKIRGDKMLVAVPEQRAAIVQRRSTVKSDLMTAEVSQRAVGAEVKSLGAMLKNLDQTMTMAKTEGSGSKAASEMRSQLFELEIQEKQLLAEFNENHHRVRNIQKQIASVKKILEAEEKQRADIVEGPSRAFIETNRSLIEKKAQLEGINERVLQLKAAVSALDLELQELNRNEIRIDQLESRIFVAKSNYQKYLAEAEQARVDEALSDSEISNIRIVPATLDPFPVFPIVPLNLAIGMVLAVFGGIALAFAGEWRISRKRQRQAEPARREAPIQETRSRPKVEASPEELTPAAATAASSEATSGTPKRLPR